MVQIQSAKYGDEFSSRDVLLSLQNSLAKEGGLNVTVNSSLVPIIDKASGRNQVELTESDKEEIQEAAAEICGETDQTCLEIKIQELSDAKIREKENAGITDSSGIIKGKRLTVVYTDESGASRTAIIPEGQRFRLGKTAGLPDLSFDYEAAVSPYREIISSFWGIVGTMVLTFLYAASIVITWMTYRKLGTKVKAGLFTAVAVLIPYSGFGLSLFGPFLREFFRTSKEVTEKVQAAQQ